MEEMSLNQALEMAEALTELDDHNAITTVGSDGDEIVSLLYKELERVKNTLSTPNSNQWISLDDGLPEKGKPIWGRLEHWNTKGARHAELKKVDATDHDWEFMDGSEIDHNWNVTHWMPLPQPPKED